MKAKRGFALLTPEQRKEISARGGAAVPAHKRSFARNRSLAQTCGVQGGARSGNRTFSDPVKASIAGKLGALARHAPDEHCDGCGARPGQDHDMGCKIRFVEHIPAPDEKD